VSKYHAQPTTLDGIRFASKKEARRWSELCLLQKAKAITDLERQVKYDLVVNDVRICAYVADFTYWELSRAAGDAPVFIVEDAKGVRTPEYRLKCKLMFAVHGITIRET
jgi:hypothetical protein